MRPFIVAGVIALITLGGASREACAREGGRTLTLADAVSAARGRGPAAVEARANAEGAEAAADAAFGGYLPNASATGSGDRSWSHSYQPDTTTPGALRGTPNNTFNTSIGGSIKWTAYDFGRTSSNVAAARADSRTATARATVESNDAAKNAAVLFLTAVFDEELVAVAQATLSLRERHTNLSRGLVAAGLRPPVEEARARVELALARLEVTSAQRTAATDRVKLATALVMDPTTPINLVRPSVLPSFAGDVRHAEEAALQRRPELKAADAAVEASEEKLDAAKADRYPKLGVALDGSYAITKPDEDARFLPARSLTAMLTATIPIFDYTVWGNVSVAHSSVAAAQARATGTRARIRGEAAESAFAVQSARSLVEEAKQARELASATLAVVEARYQSGLASPFDLFDAAKKDAEARTATIRAELALATATVEALSATGRLDELSR